MEEDTRLYLLNATNQPNFTREEEFIKLVINVEAEKPSTDLFWFLFEVVSSLSTFLLYHFIMHNYDHLYDLRYPT
jgi:hypothetical protein